MVGITLAQVTRLATANGNTHNFDGGTAANLAAVSMASGDASPNYSGSAGQIQEYQVTPALPAGTYSVAAVVHKVRATRGATGPSKYDVAVRTGGADFFSSDISPDGAWGTSQTIWAVNPNTGLAWSTAELVNASTAYNFGIKSVT